MSDRERKLAALAALPDDAIDTSDLPESEDWGNAERGRFWRPVKRSVTIRLDADVIEWFRRREPRYQTAINRILREHMEGKGGLGTAGGLRCSRPIELRYLVPRKLGLAKIGSDPIEPRRSMPHGTRCKC